MATDWHTKVHCQGSHYRNTLRKCEPKLPEFVEERCATTNPVCGIEIKPRKAYSKVKHEELALYFCSSSCEHKFRKIGKESVKHEHHH